MKRAISIFVVMATAACARRQDYTARIDVEPGAAHRACYQSQRAELRDAGPFPIVDDSPDAADE